MGLRKVCFGLVFMIALLSEAQWGNGGKSKHDQNPAVPRPLAQVPQQNEPGSLRFHRDMTLATLYLHHTVFPSRHQLDWFWKAFSRSFWCSVKRTDAGSSSRTDMALSKPTRRTTAARNSFWVAPSCPCNSVAAQCGENSIYVEVMEDFFGTDDP